MFLEAVVKANKKMRFVTVAPRRTLAGAVEGRLGFTNYKDNPGVIACDRTVVQAESLYRLDMKAYRQDTILILDEISSLIKQMCSDMTHGNRHDLNVQYFKRLIQRAARVICLDADLCSEEVETMKSLRSDFFVISNTFQRQKGDQVVLFESKGLLVAEALSIRYKTLETGPSSGSRS